MHPWTKPHCIKGIKGLGREVWGERGGGLELKVLPKCLRHLLRKRMSASMSVGMLAVLVSPQRCCAETTPETNTKCDIKWTIQALL